MDTFGSKSPAPDGAAPVVNPDTGDGAAPATATAHLARHLAIYTILRLMLVAVLTAILGFFMPLIVALMFAVIVQLPLAWILFTGPRRRVNEAMAQASAQRRTERARLQSALFGDDPAR